MCKKLICLVSFVLALGLTVPSFGQLSLDNASFEAQVMNDGIWSAGGDVWGWEAGVRANVQNNTSTIMTEEAKDGFNTCVLNEVGVTPPLPGAYIQQVIKNGTNNVLVQANQTYEVSVWVGRRKDASGDFGGILQVYLMESATGAKIDEVPYDLANQAKDTWTLQTFMMLIDTNPVGIGSNLKLGFANIGTRSGSQWWRGQVVLDDVTIAAPPKWEQLPDMIPNGIDICVDSSDGTIRHIADDFECTSSGKITQITIWGSWKDDNVGSIKKIHLEIHPDDPVGTLGSDRSNLYSKPGPEVLWSKDFGPTQFSANFYHQVSAPGEWWQDVARGELKAGGDTSIWQIDMHIDSNQAFQQTGSESQPVTYWLHVQLDTELGRFGWKTRAWPEHFMDDAVWDTGGQLPRSWRELQYQQPHPYSWLGNNSIDMAFKLVCEQPSVVPTFQPVSATTCPAVQTQCPSVSTQCPAAQTRCPAVDTQCPSSSTKCPSVSTQCPTVSTRCPAVNTQCPTSDTKCPSSSTKCPPVNTQCPTVSTQCPAGQTHCPVVQTQCPPVDTQCPSSSTKCPSVSTRCPPVNTQCPPSDTECPPYDTECPSYYTECPSYNTRCPSSDTQCPTSDTKCPTSNTKCPPVNTQCPVVDTQCPTSDTKCPTSNTKCPPVNTQCPVVDTQCPPSGTTCPPVVDTYCPSSDTKCPTSGTRCPIVNTECPTHYTQCPVVSTQCVNTECPAVTTQCPEEWSVCPPPSLGMGCIIITSGPTCIFTSTCLTSAPGCYIATMRLCSTSNNGAKIGNWSGEIQKFLLSAVTCPAIEAECPSVVPSGVSKAN